MSRLFLTLAAVAIAVSAVAQDAAPVRFFIERIEVRNAHRVSEKLVVSESLLREGAEYSEQELAAASARLSRLPFLLSADFTLEKGSDRGRHVLVITINETKPFFFLLDARPTVIDDSRRMVDYPDHFGAESQDAVLGFRHFVGGRGILHVGVTSRRDQQAFTSDYSAWAVGYTQYDIFGTRAFATVNIRLPFDSPAEGRISPQLVVGVPLTTNQTLTVNYEDTQFRKDTRRVGGIEFERQDAERLISLTWTYNDTNQPFVPTRGTIVRVTPLRVMRDRSGVRFFQVVPGPSPDPEPFTQHSGAYGVDVLASHFWELSERNSVSAGVLAGWAKVEDELSSRVFPQVARWNDAYGVLRGGYSRSIWKGDPKAGDSRLEVDVRLVLRRLYVDQGPVVFGNLGNETFHQVSGSWVRRSSWGTLRLGVGYAWGE